MDTESLHHQHIFELAPDLHVAGRLAACGYLQRLLLGERFNPRIKVAKSALLLCAINFQVASRVLEDAGAEPCLPHIEPARRKQVERQQPKRIPAYLLGWSHKPVSPTPSSHTLAYASRLPPELIQDLLSWAPPVVLTGRSPRVVGNAIAAYLAVQCLGQQQVQCYVPNKKSLPERSFLEACQLVTYGMRPIFEQHRQHVILCASSLETAQLLSGYEKAWCARIRGRA